MPAFRWTLRAPSLLAAACSLGFLASTLEARAEGAGTTPPVTSIEDLPPWALRVSGGGGVPVPGVHQDLLREEGYGGLRWFFSGSVERRVVGSLGVGVMALTGFRNATAALRADAGSFTATGQPPTYSERFSIVAFEVPVSLLAVRRRPPWFELELVPWVGAGWGKAWLYEAGDLHSAPAFGATVRAMGRGRHGGLGLALGAYSLHVDQPTSVGGPVNFGMVSLSLVGGLDAG